MADKKYSFSLASASRLPNYLRYLKDLAEQSITYVSCPMIAEKMGLSSMLVKKDLLPVIQKSGKPKLGYEVKGLIDDINLFLGYNNTKDAIIVGVGSLGKALLGYPGFASYGLRIIAGFDHNPEIINTEVNGIKILSIDKLVNLVSRMHIHIGIITVDKDHAQEVADLLIQAGILAIWNWAPTHLNVPDSIALKNEDMAASLAILSNQMKNKVIEKEEK